MYNVEITDTFGGEANYSWVSRFQIDAPADLSDRALVRRAKSLAGWTGRRCKTASHMGDCIEVRPVGECVVMFITFV